MESSNVPALCFTVAGESQQWLLCRIGKLKGVYQDEVRLLLIMADRIIDLMYLKYLKAAISYHKTRVETYPCWER